MRLKNVKNKNKNIRLMQYVVENELKNNNFQKISPSIVYTWIPLPYSESNHLV